MTDDMADRAARARDFIDASDWANAPIAPFTGDASNRRYFRLVSAAGRRAVLMDAPPGKGEDIAPFISIAAWLRDLGLSAPALYAEDRVNGFLLLEDLGDALYARAAKKGGMPERAAYLAAMDVLVSIARAQMPKAVAAYDTEAMAPLAGLAGTWYAGDDDLAKAVSAATAGALDALPSAKTTLVLRDYHAENLIWLPERAGAARVGLLDFQDARLGHPAYDLASLLHDARRDVPEEVQRALLQGFATAMEWDLADLALALATQSAQRNLRILGVFARLSLHFGKSGYVDFIPRVHSNLMKDLSHPALAPLREVASALPSPTPSFLQDLRDRCGTIPVPA